MVSDVQGYMESEQVCGEECQSRYPHEVDEKLQRSASVVVPYLISGKHGFVTLNGVCVEKRCTAAMVGDAFGIFLSIYRHPSDRSYPSNYQPGNRSEVFIVEISSIILDMYR